MNRVEGYKDGRKGLCKVNKKIESAIHLLFLVLLMAKIVDGVKYG